MMNINNILNQVLGAGQQYSRNGSVSGKGLGGLLQSALGGSNNARGAGGLGGLLQNSDQLKKLGGGAAAAGILSMILGGSNGSRGMAGSLAKMGSLAAVGSLAYKAYQDWQRNNEGSVQQGAAAQTGAANRGEVMVPTVERGSVEVENNSRLILKAMVSAAKTDGEISADEERAIVEQIGAEDREVQQWLQSIIANPPSVQQIAAEVGSDQGLAAEVYLAARIVCGDLDRKEIIYLANLQQALGLRDSFVELLEKQAGF